MTIIIVWDISIEINKDYAISKVESHYFDYIRIYSAQQWMECSVGWVIFCFLRKKFQKQVGTIFWFLNQCYQNLQKIILFVIQWTLACTITEDDCHMYIIRYSDWIIYQCHFLIRYRFKYHASQITLHSTLQFLFQTPGLFSTHSLIKLNLWW